jgi:hypothetical protein
MHVYRRCSVAHVDLRRHRVVPLARTHNLPDVSSSPTHLTGLPCAVPELRCCSIRGIFRDAVVMRPPGPGNLRESQPGAPCHTRRCVL